MVCEVRPGVGPVKKMKSVIAGSGITHVTCTERRMRVIELYSLKRVEPRIYSVSLFRDGVFCIIENFDMGLKATSFGVCVLYD